MRYLLFVVLAGCLSSPGFPEPPEPSSADVRRHSFTFDEPVTVLQAAAGFSVAAAGEPVLVASPDGTRFVGLIGCDEGLLLGTEQDVCHHTPILRSEDGRQWDLLNRGPQRRLDDGPRANGDIDLQWFNGSLHALLLGPGPSTGSVAMHHVSHDGGLTWQYVGIVGQEGVDRPWLFANQTHLFATYTANGDLPVYRLNKSGWVRHGEVDLGPSTNAGPQGPPAYGPQCDCLWMAVHATQSAGGGLVAGDLPEQRERLMLMSSPDGATWELDHDVLLAEGFQERVARWQEPIIEDARGGIWTVWVEQGRASTGSTLHVVHRDPGGDWSLSRAATPVNVAMPTLARGDPPLLAFLGSDVPGDSGRIGQWSLHGMPVDGSRESVIIDANIHQGGICSEGLFCILEAGDRALLDYMSAGSLPDGRFVVAYTADPLGEGKQTQIRYVEELA